MGGAKEEDRTFWLASKPLDALDSIRQALGRGVYVEKIRKIFMPRSGQDGNDFTAGDEQMVMLVRNLIAYEKLERVLRELMEKLLTKTHVSIDQGALQQLRVPSVSEYSQSSFVSD